MRQRELHLEGCIRENKGLIGTLEIVQHAQQELISENNLLKEHCNELERHKLLLKGQNERQEREMATYRLKVG